MADPISVDKFLGLKRTPGADKIENGGHPIFKGLNTSDVSIKGNRGRLKQNLTSISNMGKNGLFYYENSDGLRQLIYATTDSLVSIDINPIITGFFSYSTAIQLPTGRGFDVNELGNVYLLESATSNIVRYDKHGASLSNILIPDSYLGDAIRVDDSGIIYVTGNKAGVYKLFKLDNNGNELTSVTLSSQTSYLAINQGQIYLNSGVDIIIKSTSDLSTITTVTGTVLQTIKDMDSASNGKVYALWNDGTNRGIKEVTNSGMTTIVNGTDNIDGSIACDEFNRLWVVHSLTRSLFVYDISGNKIETLFEANASNFDFFKTSTAHITAITNEIIIHDYNSSNFKGIKNFLMRKA